MSTDLYRDDEIAITRFSGGIERGLCIQLTEIGERSGRDKYISLDEERCRHVHRVLAAHLADQDAVWIVWSYDVCANPIFEGVFSNKAKAHDVAQKVANKNRSGVNIAPMNIDQHVPDRAMYGSIHADAFWPGAEGVHPEKVQK